MQAVRVVTMLWAMEPDHWMSLSDWTGDESEEPYAAASARRTTEKMNARSEIVGTG